MPAHSAYCSVLAGLLLSSSVAVGFLGYTLLVTPKRTGVVRERQLRLNLY